MSEPDPTALDLVVSRDGTRLRLRVKPRARRAEIQGVHAGALKLSVTAPAEKGKANKAVFDLLARSLRIAPSSIELLSGPSSPDKTVWIPLPPEAIRERLFARHRI